MNELYISGKDLKDYALSHKWTLVDEALKEGMFLLNSPFGDYEQISFPTDDAKSYFQKLAKLSVQTLSEVHKIPFNDVVNAIRAIKKQ